MCNSQCLQETCHGKHMWVMLKSVQEVMLGSICTSFILSLIRRWHSQTIGCYHDIVEICTHHAQCSLSPQKWHPDKCSVQDRAEAKVKFQEIQEAYAVLFDERKKVLYDNGLYNPEDDDDDMEGLSNFISEISGMMTDMQASEEAGKGSSFEELQQLFVSMFSADLAALNDPSPPSATSNFDKKRSWGGGHYNASPFFGSCIVEDSFSSPQTHFFFSDTFHYGSSVDSSASKKIKSTLHGNPASTGSHANQCDRGLSNQRAQGM